MNPDTDTTHISRHSLLGRLGLNVRGVIVFTLVVTICVIAGMGREIPERLLAVASIAVGYYFGQQHQKPNS